MFRRFLWSRETTRVVDRMVERSVHESGGRGVTFAHHMTTSLPPPVARYLEFAVDQGRPLVHRARLSQSGTFALAPAAWKRFTAVEYFTVHPPAFVWDAQIHMNRLLSVRVRDSYLGGIGAMHAAVAGVVPIVDQTGTPEIGAAALLRYLAEAVWLPTALLPCEGVSWTSIDDARARATISDGGVSVSMDVTFGSAGEIVSIRAMRHRDANGVAVLTPWVGRFGEYEHRDGLMVPRAAEVEWVLADGPSPYWRGHMVEASYF